MVNILFIVKIVNGDENTRLFKVNIETKEVVPLTPAGVKAELLNMKKIIQIICLLR